MLLRPPNSTRPDTPFPYMTPFRSGVNYDLADFHIRWYADGELNASVNGLDRHLATRGDKTARVFEPDDPNAPAQHVTYRELHARVCKLGNALRNLGVV